jgi:segregation and condensation protein B
LSETLGDEPRFVKLGGAPAAEPAMSFDVDQESDG